MRFPHTLCMMHGVFILHTIISSVARNGNTGRTFSQRTLYTIQRISIPPHCHFERSEKSSLHSALSCFLRKRFPLFRCLTYGAIPVCKKDPSASLGMTLRKRRFPNISFIRDVGYLFPPTVISSAVEKSSLHSVLPCPFRGRLPILLCHTYDAIPVCKKDRGLRSG